MASSAGNLGELVLKYPLEYVRERKECVCGCCGQVVLSIRNAKSIESHFKSCKNSEVNLLTNEEIKDAMIKAVEELMELKTSETVAAQETEMTEVMERVSRVTETVSTVAHIILEVTGTPSAETGLADQLSRSMKELKAIRAQLRDMEPGIQAMKTQLEEEIAPKKMQS